MPRVVVVIPALNEEQSLPLVLRDLPPVDAVIVVDNGSTDATARRAEQGGARVISEPRRGYGTACQAGIRAAEALHPDVLVILDADWSDHPEELPLLTGPVLRDEADLVMGDRTVLAAKDALLPHQRFGNRLATAAMSWVAGHRYRDMGPFRAIRWSALQRLHMSDPTYGWNVEMQLKALRQGLRVLEVPVHYRPRVGQSKISGTVKGSVQAGVKILSAVRRYA